jgi:hypothetical protein
MRRMPAPHVEDEVTGADAAHLARASTGAGKHCSEREIAFRPGQAPSRARRSRGDQDPGELTWVFAVASVTNKRNARRSPLLRPRQQTRWLSTAWRPDPQPHQDQQAGRMTDQRTKTTMIFHAQVGHMLSEQRCRRRGQNSPTQARSTKWMLRRRAK